MDGMTDTIDPSGYVELHCHSCFSLLDGAASPEGLVDRARALGQRALALTDHADLGGAVRFSGAGRVQGSGDDHRRGTRPDGPAHRSPLTAHVPCSPGGVQHRLRQHLHPHHPRAHGLPARRARRSARPARAPRRWRHRAHRLPARLGAVAPRCRGYARARAARRCPSATSTAIASSSSAGIMASPRNASSWRSSFRSPRALGVPWVVTNDVHYARPQDRRVHDVLTALRHKATLDQMGTRLRPNGEWYLKSAAQMARRWRHAPEGVRATLAIAERCAFRLEQLQADAAGVPLPPGVGEDEYLARLGDAGARGTAGERNGARGTGNRRTQAARPRARRHRAARARRLLPHRVGHRALRAAQRDPLPGPRLRRQFRRLLLPRHHRGRSDQAWTCSSSAS